MHQIKMKNKLKKKKRTEYNSEDRKQGIVK